MKNLLPLAVAFLAVSAAAQQAPKPETVVVADKALAKIVFNRDQVCSRHAKARAAYDADYGSVSPAEATPELLEEMLPRLRDVQSLKGSCDQNSKAAAARVDALLGAGTAARVRSAIVFEGKVTLVLTPAAPKDDAETWKRIEDGWKHGATCP